MRPGRWIHPVKQAPHLPEWPHYFLAYTRGGEQETVVCPTKSSLSKQFSFRREVLPAKSPRVSPIFGGSLKQPGSKRGKGKVVEISKEACEWKPERSLCPLKLERLFWSVAGILEAGTPKLSETAEVQLSFLHQIIHESQQELEINYSFCANLRERNSRERSSRSCQENK